MFILIILLRLVIPIGFGSLMFAIFKGSNFEIPVIIVIWAFIFGWLWLTQEVQKEINDLRKGK